MAEYGNNFEYGESPFYKDDTNTLGAVIPYKKDPTSSDLIQKEFPLLDIIPVEVYFGITGLDFTPISYYWDFGDGNSSNKRDPSHVYTSYGSHRVFAFVRERYNGVWINVGGYLNYITLGKLGFNGNPQRGDKPLSVQFANESIAPTGCHFTGLQWDFGDSFGITGMSSPQHSYIDYGSYTVGIKSTFDKL